jgi:hypothetical protein
MNRLPKYCRREIYSLATVKRSTDFKHQKSIIRTVETSRIWQGLNRWQKKQPVNFRASALTTQPFNPCTQLGRKVIYLLIHIHIHILISHKIHCLNYHSSINVSSVCSNYIELHRYADEFTSVIKKLCDVFCQRNNYFRNCL